MFPCDGGPHIRGNSWKQFNMNITQNNCPAIAILGKVNVKSASSSLVPCKKTTPTLKMTGQILALEIRSKRATVALTTAIHTSIPVLSSSGTYQTQITFSPIAVNKEKNVKSAHSSLVLCRTTKNSRKKHNFCNFTALE